MTREAAAQKILAGGRNLVFNASLPAFSPTTSQTKLVCLIKYSMKKPSQHKDYTDAVIALLRSINPHSAEEGRIGYVYASGFLAAYLASLMVEDPFIYKRFKRHIDSLNQGK